MLTSRVHENAKALYISEGGVRPTARLAGAGIIAELRYGV